MLVTGVVSLVAGMLRLGFVTQFLSKPVMDGFVMGLAIFVAVGQLNKLFGVEKPEGNTVQKLVGILKELPEANWVSFAIGAVSLVVLFALPRVNPKLPAGLVVLFGTILVSKWLDLEGTQGVEVVGALPQGLPSLTFTAVPLETYLAMVLPAMGVFLVAYSESLGVAHEFADKHGYEVDANQELNAHAATNFLSSLFGGMLAAGGMSGSAVKEGAGAESQVANLVTWVATVITLLFFTPLFATLPEAVLGALIIHAVWHLIASRKLRTLRQESRTEFWFGLLAMLGVLLIDVLEGMIIGLVASLVFVVYQSSRPHLASVSRIPGAPRRVLRPGAAPGEHAGARRADPAAARGAVLRQRPDCSRPGARLGGCRRPPAPRSCSTSGPRTPSTSRRPRSSSHSAGSCGAAALRPTSRMSTPRRWPSPGL